MGNSWISALGDMADKDASYSSRDTAGRRAKKGERKLVGQLFLLSLKHLQVFQVEMSRK